MNLQFYPVALQAFPELDARDAFELLAKARTLADAWDYARCYGSEDERRAALPAWLREYNHHRPHTARGNKPPNTRLANRSGQYT